MTKHHWAKEPVGVSRRVVVGPYDGDMQRTVRSAIVGIGALVLTVSGAACTTAGEDARTMPPQASSTEPTDIPETPSATSTAQPPECDAVLTQAGAADLAGDNLTPREFEFQSWDYALLQTISTKGVVCKWAGGGDVFVVLGQLPMDEQTWKATRVSLEAEGYVLDESHGLPGFINGPDGSDESYPNRGFAWRNGILYYASYPGILEFVPAFQS